MTYKTKQQLIISIFVFSITFMACQPEIKQDVIQTVTISPNESADQNNCYDPGTEVTLSTNPEYTIYYSYDKNYASLHYPTQGIKAGKGSATIKLKKSGPLSAVAVTPTGLTSEISVSYLSLNGPDTVEATPAFHENGNKYNILLSSKIPQKIYDTGFFPQATAPTQNTLTLTGQEGQTIKYKLAVNADIDDSTPENEYTSPINLEALIPSDKGIGLTTYFTLQSYSESNGKTSYFETETYTFVPLFYPKYISDEDSENFNYDSFDYKNSDYTDARTKHYGIKEVINKIDDNIFAVDVSSKDDAYIIKAYVISAAEKNVTIQDKDDGINLYIYYKDYAPEFFYEGQYVEMCVRKGYIYNNTCQIKSVEDYEISETQTTFKNNAGDMACGNIITNSTKDTAVLYYNNLNKIEDFSGLETLQLCGIKTDGKAYKDNLSAMILDDTVYSKNAPDKYFLSEEPKALYGTVRYQKAKNELRFVVSSIKDKSTCTDLIGLDTQSLKDILPRKAEPIYLQEEVITQENPILYISSITRDSKIYYNINADEDYVEYNPSSGVDLSGMDSGLHRIYAKVAPNNPDIKPSLSTADFYYLADSKYEFVSMASHADELNTNSYQNIFNSATGKLNGPIESWNDSSFTQTSLSNTLTFTFNKFTCNASSNSPYYDKDFNNVVFYKDNIISIKSSSRLIKRIYFIYGASKASKLETMTGELIFGKDESLNIDPTNILGWEGPTNEVLFKATGSKFQIESFIIEYDEESSEFSSPSISSQLQNSSNETIEPLYERWNHLYCSYTDKVTLTISNHTDFNYYYDRTTSYDKTKATNECPDQLVLESDSPAVNRTFALYLSPKSNPDLFIKYYFYFGTYNYPAKNAASTDLEEISVSTFNMGSNAGNDNNKPVHEVSLTRNFLMCSHEVTNGDYNVVMTNKNGTLSPMANVSWYMAIAYCNKLSLILGLEPCYALNGTTDPSAWGPIPTSDNTTWNSITCNFDATGYRLPTEAEWEYAARAGNENTEDIIWSGTSEITELGDYAWYSENSESSCKTVSLSKNGGPKTNNSYNLYDMSGNVAEWVWDKYTDGDIYTSEPITDPTGNASGVKRIVRGGSYNDSADNCSVTNRKSASPSTISAEYGFRVCRTIKN